MALTTKQAARKMIGNMAEDASLEDILYELYFRQRIDRGLGEFEEGRTVSHEAVKRSLVKWFHPAQERERRWG